MKKNSYLYQTGDGEGGNEMTGSMQMLREFCDLVVTRDKATKTRIVRYPHLFHTLTSFLLDKVQIKRENYVL